MMYQKISDETGPYTDAQGNTYTLLCCNCAQGPEGINIGWSKFKSLKAALKAFGLTEIK